MDRELQKLSEDLQKAMKIAYDKVNKGQFAGASLFFGSICSIASQMAEIANKKQEEIDKRTES